MADAAQNFLDSKLSKNRFTIKQQERLDASGGPSVAGYGDGVVPGGSAYEKYGKMPSNESNDSNTPAPATTKPTATSTWDGSNYSQGAFNADDLKKHFKLEDGSDVGDGFNKDAGATDSNMTKDNDLLGEGYLSNKNYDRLKNDDKVKAAYASLNGQAAADKKFKDGGLSINTLDALFDDLTARANQDAPAAPEKERTPIERSPEIKQATERVRAYEDNIMSGKTSQDIFGGYYGNTGLDLNNATTSESTDQVETAINYGGTGIGTSTGAEPVAKAATYSFLDSKKTSLKDKMNFIPAN